MSKSIAKLIFECNGNIVKKLRLVQNNPAKITIGKNSYCSVVYYDPEVSRMHAEINFNGDKITIKDINSTNGTYLNGSRIQSGKFCMLNLGDNVTFSNTGNSRLVVSFADDQLGANNPSPASVLVDRSKSKKINNNLILGVGIIILFGIFYYLNKEKNPLNIKLKDLNEPCDYVNTDLKILEDYYEILEENEGEDVADWNHSDKKELKN
jgi:pSer/pThr/pTyr-binding forkhead associated (FHA) protein